MKDSNVDLIGMKAVDALKILPTKNVKIGAKGGMAFFYCGNANKFKEIDAVGKFDEYLIGLLEERVNSGKERILTYIKSYPTPEKYLLSCLNNEIDFSFDSYISELKEFFRLAEVKKKNIEISMDRIASRVPFDERVVLDAYMSIDEEDCMILLIDGVESGKYWTIDECSAGERTNG